MEPRILKRQRVNMHNNEKEQSLDKYESEDERKDIGYILFLFITPPSSSQKKSNRSTDIGKGIKSPNHLIYLPKIGLLYNS